ncbi:putative amino acid transporter [Gordonia namibiensis NBRC 108229]|uniref:Putative amino acid transporter n=1 Tax=Gordonia namibiensis NBRC 108229 TaxID=1208314 RepID=K6XIK9_9ACTN|nr:amino acid permease [Gordonia namibiensis]GAB98674.1 putative amino acid transporter [Gordonia namibiensis NBRC 108229]
MSDQTSRSDATEVSAEFGYKPELKRTLGSFQVFAVSFAFISVAVGIFGTYGMLLNNSGPVGIWTWLIALAGQLLVALVIAQFAARIPLSGSSYQWASRLANPRVGWIFGWLTFCYLVTGLMAIDFAMASQCLMPLFNMAPDEQTARVITVVVLLVQAALAIASTRLVGLINSLAVGVEVTIVIVLVIALLVAVAVTGDGSVSNLGSRGVAVDSANYFAFGGGLMAVMIVGLATLVGFESAANMAEEAKDPHRTVPRAIVGSVAAAGILGMMFLIGLTVAIDDIAKVTASGSPVATIMRDQLGAPTERILLVVIAIAFFGGGLVSMTSCARIVFAMSRDRRFPAHRLMKQVSPRTQTPIPATVLPLAIGVIAMIVIPGDALIELITAGTLFPAITYGLVVTLYLVVRKRLDRRTGAFDLGRFELPVAVVALVWTVCAIVILVSPSDATVPVIIVGGLILLGSVYFAYMLVFRREVLDTEPGHDVFGGTDERPREHPAAEDADI